MAENAHTNRRLAAILAADVVGYSRMMAADEDGTLAALKHHRETIFNPAVARHKGRVVKLIGDGTLVEFTSVVDAVKCALAMQRSIKTQSQLSSGGIALRIGINLGDVIIDGDDIYGDGVNVAARLEPLADPGGICVSGIVIESVGNRIEVTFSDGGEVTVKNIDRPIRVWKWHPNDDTVSAKLALKPALMETIEPEQPSIAVLPFQNMSGDSEQEHFCDGLVEDIITTLSKLSGLRVIARNSSFVYKGRSVDVREAAKQLGVRYVLEGSVRKSGNRIRVTAQLIDAKDGAHLWAERYDRSIDDIFAIQDEITLVLATEMQVKLTDGEQARLRYTTTSNVEAWTYWVQGLSAYRQPVTKEQWGKTRPYWEKALALDPNSAALNAMLGFVHYADARFGWWDDREVALEKAHAYKDRALELDPNNGDAFTTSSLVHLLRAQYDEAMADARRAVELAPSSADTATFACFVLASAGAPEEAVRHIERAMTLSPNYPASYLGHLGNAYRLAGRFKEAIKAFKAYDARHAGFGLTDLVIAFQEIGQPDKAKQTAKRLLAARPGFTIASWTKTQFRRDTERYEADIAALRAAELPDQ